MRLECTGNGAGKLGSALKSGSPNYWRSLSAEKVLNHEIEVRQWQQSRKVGQRRTPLQINLWEHSPCGEDRGESTPNRRKHTDDIGAASRIIHLLNFLNADLLSNLLKHHKRVKLREDVPVPTL
ncbi:hypothetical protein DdX_03846 [Ditylenchus destructor]|uniref:Uncharacterized protein n=1 Tax=Ditylenchus destructor TaxID=166010 RepID=A0AAD4N9I3_9BILA|nr:hypothetical protein DdX_03846 [Ditylenchus destructor]